MKQIQQLIQYHKIPTMALAEALDMTWYQLRQRVYVDEVEFDKTTSLLFSKYLKTKHGIYIEPDLLQKYSRTTDDYSLDPHGKWEGRDYLETKRGYQYDPRMTAQDLLARVGLPIVKTSSELEIAYPRILNSKVLSLLELQRIVDMANGVTGNEYHALDLVSRFIPLDKLTGL